MKILIANNEMENFFGGTQTWTITMVKVLRELGHIVHFTGVNKKINPAFQNDFEPLIDAYDLLIANGNTTLNTFKGKAPVTIFISHGILPQLEQPVHGADIYLAVSEEVEQNIISKGFKCDGIIRNPIDIQKFSTSNEVKEIKTIGFLDRRRKFPFLKEVENRYNVIQIGNPPTTKIKEELDKCDVVVALGRGAYEAMSLGKNVIVSGNNSGRAHKLEIMDGYVDNTTFFDFRKNNCSGRYNNINVNKVETFLQEIDKINLVQGPRNRKLIEENNDANLIAKQLIQFYESSSSQSSI